MTIPDVESLARVINRARYPDDREPRELEDEDRSSQEYARRIARAVIAALTSPIDGIVNTDDHLIAARPDWARVYRDVAHTPDRDSDLVPVTRETLRLALHALQKQNGEDYYHNYGAAANELYIVLGATTSLPPHQGEAP